MLALMAVSTVPLMIMKPRLVVKPYLVVNLSVLYMTGRSEYNFLRLYPLLPFVLRSRVYAS